MTREETAWVHYWSNIYYDLVSAHEAVPWETLEFVNCVLKGALFQYNDATMKAIEILRYFGVQRTIKFYPRLRSRDLCPNANHDRLSHIFGSPASKHITVANKQSNL
jgi:hypothetical protein